MGNEEEFAKPLHLPDAGCIIVKTEIGARIMGIEFELKFRATPEKLETIRKTVPGEEQTIAMETTYYDTRQRALSDRHYTLRRRMENGVCVCTLKTPAGALGRGEYELPCQRIEDAIEKLCKLSGVTELPALTEAGLEPVCGARFTRIAKTLVLSDCTVELALDEGVLTGGGRQMPLCEVEVELKAGCREAAAAYAEALAAAVGLETEKYSKFRRALALARGE